MSSDWDVPETYRPGARVSPTPEPVRAPDSPSARDSGVIDPLALFRFVIGNIVKIGAIALALTAIGIVLVSLIPFPYRATATVLVDPRNEQVTLQEDVLQPIGSDAAVLESMIQIMRSDGFLLTVMDKLGMLGDLKTKLSEDEQLQALAKFKSNLSVERKGATYLVEISYKAGTAQEAAKIANSVANEFANAQNGQVRQATEDAGRALSERLVDLRRKLSASEKAVADFAAENGILYIDDNNTLQMRQLTELSAQLAVAKNATEAARARYQSQTGAGAGDVVLSDPRNGETEQLSFLRQQRAQLKQSLDRQSLTYGSRHPRIAQTRQALEGIERQIREERQNLTRQLKGELEVAEVAAEKARGRHSQTQLRRGADRYRQSAARSAQARGGRRPRHLRKVSRPQQDHRRVGADQQRQCEGSVARRAAAQVEPTVDHVGSARIRIARRRRGDDRARRRRPARLPPAAPPAPFRPSRQHSTLGRPGTSAAGSGERSRPARLAADACAQAEQCAANARCQRRAGTGRETRAPRSPPARLRNRS